MMLVSDNPMILFLAQSHGQAEPDCRILFQLFPGPTSQQCGGESDVITCGDIESLDREHAAVPEMLEKRSPAIPVGVNSFEFVRRRNIEHQQIRRVVRNNCLYVLMLHSRGPTFD